MPSLRDVGPKSTRSSVVWTPTVMRGRAAARRAAWPCPSGGRGRALPRCAAKMEPSMTASAPAAMALQRSPDLLDAAVGDDRDVAAGLAVVVVAGGGAVDASP